MSLQTTTNQNPFVVFVSTQVLTNLEKLSQAAVEGIEAADTRPILAGPLDQAEQVLAENRFGQATLDRIFAALLNLTEAAARVVDAAPGRFAELNMTLGEAENFLATLR